MPASSSAGRPSITRRPSISTGKRCSPETGATAGRGCDSSAGSSTVSIHWVCTAKVAVANAGSSMARRSNGITVAGPSTASSRSARRARTSAASRVSACTMSFAIIESNAGCTVSPTSMPPSHRTPGPPGMRRASTRPGLGRNPRPGSSALMRNSNACPVGAGVSVKDGPSPNAIRNCSRTRSVPVTSSVTGCSTCSRVFTSRNEIVPSAARRNSTVPAPRYCTSAQIARAASWNAARCASVRPGAGASSMSFWLRRCMEQSRSPTTTTPPRPSPSTCTSMCRGLSRKRSTKHSPRPNAAVASRVAASNASATSDSSRTTLSPRPPPPNAALIAIGRPCSSANATASCGPDNG